MPRTEKQKSPETLEAKSWVVVMFSSHVGQRGIWLR